MGSASRRGDDPSLPARAPRRLSAPDQERKLFLAVFGETPAVALPGTAPGASPAEDDGFLERTLFVPPAWSPVPEPEPAPAPAETWPAWTDRKTCEAGDWRLGPDDAAVPADEWPAWTDDIAFGAAVAPPAAAARGVGGHSQGRPEPILDGPGERGEA